MIFGSERYRSWLGRAMMLEIGDNGIPLAFVALEVVEGNLDEAAEMIMN
jgi:hypothetical protein